MTRPTPTPARLFERAAHEAAAVVIAQYSTSFGMAVRLLREPVRTAVRDVYAMVRVADEVVDGACADLPTQEVIAALFRDLSARGTTILVVLHEIGPLEGAIQRAVVLDHGLVVHDGPVGERPLLDPGHDHSHHATPIDECLGQELHPA